MWMQNQVQDSDAWKNKKEDREGVVFKERVINYSTLVQHGGGSNSNSTHFANNVSPPQTEIVLPPPSTQTPKLKYQSPSIVTNKPLICPNHSCIHSLLQCHHRSSTRHYHHRIYHILDLSTAALSVSLEFAL